MNRYIGWFFNQPWYVKAVILAAAIVAVRATGTLCAFVHYQRWRERGGQGGEIKPVMDRLKEAVATGLMKLIAVVVLGAILFGCLFKTLRDWRSRSA